MEDGEDPRSAEPSRFADLLEQATAADEADDVAVATDPAGSDAGTDDAPPTPPSTATADGAIASDPTADPELAQLEQLLQSLAGAFPPAAAVVAPLPQVDPLADATVARVATSDVAAALVMNDAGAGSQTLPVPPRNGAKAPTVSADAAAVAAAGENAATDENAIEWAADLADLTDGGAGAPTDSNTGSAPIHERLALELAITTRPVANPPIAGVAPVAVTPGLSTQLNEMVRPLAALPALLDDAFDGAVRLRRNEGRWEAEIRLDPAELGAVNVRIEFDGEQLRVVARCDDREVERQLGELFKGWDETLREQGRGSSFDLHQRAKGEEERRDAAARRFERSNAAPRAARHAGGAGPGGDRRVDLLA
ncbi:MAG: flagellar hook-length control protein FliK [Planctomycetes bacterium]|nr:flagellar hook-length control protein FliK [Planctomycetota bacterium]